MKCALGLEQLPAPCQPDCINSRKLNDFRTELYARCGLQAQSDDREEMHTAKDCDSDALANTIERTADCVVQHWGRQLKGLGNSSTEFLRSKCLQREGMVQVRPKRVDIWFAPIPFDVALQISGLFDPFDYFVGTKMTKIIYYTRPTPSGGRS